MFGKYHNRRNQSRRGLRILRPWIAALAALGAAVTLAPAETKRFDASAGEKLSVELEIGGGVEITGDGGNAVEVTWELHGKDVDRVDFSVTRTGDGVRVRAERPGKTGRRFDANVDLTIRVPERFDVGISTMGGDLRIEGVDGSIKGSTMGGEIRLANLRGTLGLSTMGGSIRLRDSDVDGKVSTMGGNIEMSDVIGNVDASTMGGNVIQRNVARRGGRGADEVKISSQGGNVELADAPEGARITTMGGNIVVESASKFVKATTMGGNIQLKQVDGAVNASTMGGNVEVRVIGDGGGDGDVEISSHAGELVLELPRGYPVEIEAELVYTRDSRKSFKIDSSLPLKIEESPEWTRRPGHDHDEPVKVITGTATIGGGKHKVRLKTVNGNIKIRER